jgi:hypothetical protein
VDKVDKSTLSTQTETETETETEKEYSYNHCVIDIETKESKDIISSIESKENVDNVDKPKGGKNNLSGKDFVSISRNNVDMQKLLIKLVDLFAIDPDTADYTAMVNLARQALPEHFPVILKTAINILDKSTIKKPLAVFFHTLKRENIYNANTGVQQ